MSKNRGPSKTLPGLGFRVRVSFWGFAMPGLKHIGRAFVGYLPLLRDAALATSADLLQ